MMGEQGGTPASTKAPASRPRTREEVQQNSYQVRITFALSKQNEAMLLP